MRGGGGIYNVLDHTPVVRHVDGICIIFWAGCPIFWAGCILSYILGDFKLTGPKIGR
jgi:hypothetical protein